MELLKLGCSFLILIALSKRADAALDTACTADGECDTGEVCDDAASGGSGLCICDVGSSYSAGPTSTNNCFLTVNLGSACTADDECELGDGSTSAVCSTTCVIPVNLGNACTSDDECVAGDGGAGTKCSTNCVTPVNLGNACTSDDECVAGDGGAGTKCSTTTNNCVTPKNLGDACTSDDQCVAGGGGAGTKCSTTCVTPVNLGSACSSNDECVAGDGGAGTVCDTNCKKDCGSPTSPTGYTLTLSTAGATLAGDTADVACATGYAGTPSSATVACQAGGTWVAPAGCAIDAKDLGETCDIDEQCAAGDGGASSVCDTSCKTGSGASEIRQKFSIVILIGSIVIALM